MPICDGCKQIRKHLENGLCILCRIGPGGKSREVNEIKGVRRKGREVFEK